MAMNRRQTSRNRPAGLPLRGLLTEMDATRGRVSPVEPKAVEDTRGSGPR
jgi:hypothetical protein